MSKNKSKKKGGLKPSSGVDCLVVSTICFLHLFFTSVFHISLKPNAVKRGFFGGKLSYPEIRQKIIPANLVWLKKL